MAALEVSELETLSLELVDEDVAVLRMNHPDRMNSQTVQMFAEYGKVAHALQDGGLRALVLTGIGERAFCAGVDLDEIEVITRMGVGESQETATGGIQAIRHLPFPVIAAVHGPATGGGLALAADLRYAAPTAKFGAAFVNVELSIGELGTSYNLSRIVGASMAAEIGFTGRLVKTEEAARIGLVDRLVPSDELFEDAVQTAQVLAANTQTGVRMSKRAIQRNQEISSYAAAFELKNRGQALLTRTEDMPEALTAFKDKRTPRLTAR